MRQETKIILVEPSGPLNIGSVARLCENFGIKELRLVAPRCNSKDKEAIKMAVRGRRLLENAPTYSCLLDAISDCQRVIATCGRIDHGSIPLCPPEEALTWGLDTRDESPIALVFGREDRGLTNKELQLAQKVLTLKTITNYQSINLSHAVAIVLHELERIEAKSLIPETKKVHFNDPAYPIEIYNCLNDAEALLLEIGFLYEHTAKARMSKISALLQRAEVRPEEIALIRGIFRQMRWAMRNRNS
ncbi:RNA methyltransferase [Prochlorococcus sp. MIT 1307]|uniref:RNA methyltransferase n=1 Tax=Prochlorococcus sp. MIT 1307 TaxID=3096219 RepID=UPI002A74F755|nr:RNA methyltransferase [Prochlorococcus sp. MIT 1307]